MRSGNRARRISNRAVSAFRRNIAAALVVLFWAVAPVRGELAIVETVHRPAAELLPAIAPFVEPDGTITAQGFNLVVSAPPETVATVRDIVSRLDAPLRRLRIAVRQGSAQQGSNRRIQGGIRVGEHSGVDAGAGSVGPNGVAVSVQDERWRAAGRVLSTSGSLRDNAEQQVTVLEGRPAHIYVGLEVPYPTTYGVGGVLAQGTEYRQVATGFEVLARLRADQVWLDISPIQESLAGQGRDLIAVQGLSTTVTGALGEWIAAGYLSRQDASQESGILFRAGSAASEEREIYFRVEEY